MSQSYLQETLVVLSLALGAVIHAHAATPFQQRCEQMAAGSGGGARFASHAGGYRIDNGISYVALTQMKRPSQQAGLVLGLTRAESRVDLQIDGPTLQDPASGIECAAPRITVTLSYPPIVVYVGREFAAGTCAYREILAHEMRHLKSYTDALPKVEEQVRERLGRRFDGKPLYARAGQARGLLQQEINGNWLPYIKNEMLKIDKLQEGIDSPQEYARLSKVCAGEVQSLIRSTRRTRSSPQPAP